MTSSESLRPLVKVKERGILFSGDMVRAILSGQKTQTRRPVRGIDLWDDAVVRYCKGGHHGPGLYVSEAEYPEEGSAHYSCPYGQPGDRLWVRETFSTCMSGNCCAWYWADGNPNSGDWTKPKPSIHMPRWASRITLEITSVRVERIKDIIESDATWEGFDPEIDGWKGTEDGIRKVESYVKAFALTWEKTYPGSWGRNEWVWVIEFKRIEASRLFKGKKNENSNY